MKIFKKFNYIIYFNISIVLLSNFVIAYTGKIGCCKLNDKIWHSIFNQLHFWYVNLQCQYIDFNRLT